MPADCGLVVRNTDSEGILMEARQYDFDDFTTIPIVRMITRFIFIQA